MENAQYTQYYIAFLDILGFKDLVSSASCQDILNIYDAFGAMREVYYSGEPEDAKNDIKMKIMSDSICVYIEANIPNALSELVSFCTAFQYDLLTLDTCTFVRGGITCGDMYIKDDTVFGPALTEAYLLEEKNARVPRIIMCKDTLNRGWSNADKDSQEFLDMWTFRDDDAFYTLNYFALLCLKDNNEEVIARVNTTISKWLDTTINESIRQKYLYVEKNIHKYLKEKPNA